MATVQAPLVGGVATWRPTQTIGGVYTFTARWRDAGLAGSDATIVDLTPPSVTVAVAVAPIRASGADGGADERDPADADAGIRSWRRDETALVTLTSTSADLDAGSVRLFVGNFEVPLADAGACGGAYCRIASVDLWRPTFNAYRGTIPISVTAADDLSNAGASDGGSIAVTRWKWRIPVPDLVISSVEPSSSVALDRSGNLYLTTASSSADAGTIAAYSPAGTRLWSRATDEFPVAPPALGDVSTQDAGVLAYVVGLWSGGAKTQGSAYPIANPSQGALWAAPGDLRLQTAGPLVSSAGTWERVFLSFFKAGVVQVASCLVDRWPPSVITQIAEGTPTTPPSLTALTANGDRLFLADRTSAAIFAFTWNSGGYLDPDPTFPGTFPGMNGWHSVTSILDGGLVGVGTDGTDESVFEFAYPSSPGASATFPGVPISPPLIRRGASTFVARDSSSARMRLCRSDFATTACTSDNAEDLGWAGALGEGGVVYTIATKLSTGRHALQARSQATLAVLWEVADDNVPTEGFTLDCRRSGGPGVLYGGARFTVYAVIVDSKGVDATADWPLYGHDPRNSNDVQSTLTPWTCP